MLEGIERSLDRPTLPMIPGTKSLVTSSNSLNSYCPKEILPTFLGALFADVAIFLDVLAVCSDRLDGTALVVLSRFLDCPSSSGVEVRILLSPASGFPPFVVLCNCEVCVGALVGGTGFLAFPFVFVGFGASS